MRLLVALLVVLASGFGIAPRWAAVSASAAGTSAGAGGVFATAEGTVHGLARGGSLLPSLTKAFPRPASAGTAPEGCGDLSALLPEAAPAPQPGPAVHEARPCPSVVRVAASGHLTSRAPTGPPAA
ncbi:hypothetical protein ACM64Y_08725 [Novispirillum sp. DQ9]|uniref:hypothetical protein n=1 Tax=Novispirillum sp. DQ9 TaxID=3398612 RepID=UPI003C7B4F13